MCSLRSRPHDRAVFCVGEGEVYAVAAIHVLVSGFGRFTDFQRLIANIAGTKIYAVLVLCVETESGFAAVFHALPVLPLVLTVGRQYGAAAVEYAGIIRATVCDSAVVPRLDTTRRVGQLWLTLA